MLAVIVFQLPGSLVFAEDGRLAAQISCTPVGPGRYISGVCRRQTGRENGSPDKGAPHDLFKIIR
jgi:hypothetical protein